MDTTGLKIWKQLLLLTRKPWLQHINLTEDIDFNNDNYNNYFNYKDANNVNHDVYFTDAATNFNTIRFADEYGTAGTALWRLGSEDERLWLFYNRSLTNNSLKQQPFNFDSLQLVNTPVERPDYIGDGEILNVITEPEPGKINIEIDSTEGIISEAAICSIAYKICDQEIWKCP
jgi:hypothetical protein